MMIRKLSTIACLVAVGLVAGSASAAPAAPVKIELNKLEAQGDACRAYLVFENTGDAELTGFKLDLVMFGADGVITGRMAVDAAPIRPRKTTVKLFDIPATPCDQIGRVLINDIVECGDIEGLHSDCIARVEPSSRASAEFIK